MGQDFDVEKLKGLSDDEVASRLSGEGYNELPQSKIRGSIYSA
ncbi:MAG TPA: cation-transporting P-type ATPase [Spirochaetota bacterium]|nr:cation-transporting P-type ATPase [Spirochaetota bacterium]HPD05519.1 cation-transporting P-type ATPase [Spirochaetota bacterium]HRV16192.1 cation-transporting P-type ATPase [Spirochaetota bacterium]